jgi:hypothetical protein
MASDPIHSIWLIFGMLYSPPFSCILLLYLPLTLIVMPLFLWGAKRNAVATLCASGLVWLTSQLFPQFGSVITERTWLNPLAWQFPFVIGMFFGIRYYTLAEQPLSKRVGWLVAAAWMVVGLSFLFRFSLFVSPHIGLALEWLRIPGPTKLHMKETLSPIRLLHFLSIALLFATYIRSNNSILQSFVSIPFIKVGQKSLVMFSVSAVLSMASNVFVLAENPSMLVHLVLISYC